MNQEIFYKLPELNYDFDALGPQISSEQLRIHYEKHHQSYVDGANKIFSKINDSRENNVEFDLKCVAKELSFNIGGHILHSLFWGNLISDQKSKEKPEGVLMESIEKEFKNFNNFKTEFSQTALTVEGSGWAALGYCKETEKLIIIQIEKHNINIIPGCSILMVLDVFEHAYYLDYKNNRKEYIENFWKIINWDEIKNRFQNII